MAGHPARNRSVRCAASQSGRAMYEISRRSSPTAITNATPISTKFPSLHSKIMRWHHDRATLENMSRKGLSPQATELRIVGLPLTTLSAWDASKPQRLNPSDNMENYYEEVHTLRSCCNSGYIACDLGSGTASDLGTGILCAVLSQRQLSE